MMKTFFKKRIWSWILTVVMIFQMFPAFTLTASAAGTLTVTDDNIGLSWTDASNSKGTANWTASGNTVTGTAKGYVQNLVYPKTVNTTLTITNNHSDDRTLSFDFTLSGGGSVSGTSGTAGSYSDTLAAGASATITLTSPSGNKINTLTISGLALLSSGNVTSTFLAPENGSYTVDGAAVTAQTTKEKAATEAYTLNATPASGYIFFGWWSNASNSYVSYDNPASVKFGSDPQLKPVFLSADTALFGVGAKTFADLTEAANYALTATTKTVVLLNNGTLRGEHTIPAGVTLLIPFNDSNTLYTNAPACTSSFLNNVAWVKPTAYRTLTMAAYAKITVNGAMSLSAKHAAANGGSNFCGSPTGPVSVVNMEDYSNITVNNGGKLYAWGFITGSGSVTANSGATVYENFQVTDFRGGTATGAYADNGLAFPLNQYYVQNIEVPVTFYAGASEKIYTSAFASQMCIGGEATFIGTGGMFTSSEGGYVVKDFDESRDRLNVDLYGSCELNSMTVKFSIEVDSANYLLPITNNVSIGIHSGTTTLKQSVALLPGVEVTVDQGATLNLAYSGTAINDFCTDGYNIIVYDRDEWFYGIDLLTDPEAEEFPVVENPKYGNVLNSSAPLPNGYSAKPSYFVPVLYAHGRTGGRTDADLKDAVLNINGTLVANGFVYTTIGGASIISSEKTGEIIMKAGAGADMITFQNNGTTSTTLGLMIRSAWLQNGDGSYLQTMTFDDETGDVVYAAAPGTKFEYCATHDCWYTDVCEQCNIPTSAEITWVVDGESHTQEFDFNATPVYNDGNDPTKASDENYHYTFAGWATETDGEALSELPAVTGEATYYAVFTAVAHDDDKIEGGKHYCTVCNYLIGSCNDTNKDHKCDVGGETLSECADDDKNHNCDVCGELVACHQGTLTPVSKKDATCAEAGYKAYYECSCGKYYEDEQAQTLIGDSNALAAWKTGEGKISATGDHVYDNACDATCNVCDATRTPADHVYDNACDATCNVCDATRTPADHVYDNACDATCNVCDATREVGDHVDTTPKDHKCDICDKTLSQCADNDNNHKCDVCGELVACHQGTLTYVSKKDATCAEAGYEAYYICSCGKLYSDEFAENAITEPVEIPATGAHSYTYTPNGDTHTVGCENCDYNVSASHDYTFDAENHKCRCGDVEKFLVQWDVEGTIKWEEYVEYGSDATLTPAVPEKEGHTGSWVGSTTNITEATTIVAEYEKNTYKVYYYVDSEQNLVYTQEVVFGETIPEYTYTPDNAGYMFTGWVQSIPSTMPAHNLEVYGSTVAKTFTVTWNVDGKFYEETSVTFGAAITVPAYTAPEGYTFDGWTVPETMPANDLVLDATLTVKTYTIIWKVDGEKIAETSVTFGAAITVPEYTAPEGHTFSGWDVPATMPAGDLVLEATLTVNSYNVTWNVDGKFYEETSVTFGAAITAPAYTAPEGYTFSGWQNIPATMPAENITLNATLTIKTYTITWVVDGVEKTATFEHGDIPVFDGIPAKDADTNFTYTFNGWDKEIVSATADVTYTAVFTKTGFDSDGKYFVQDIVQKTGWTEIDGAWYYLDPTTGARAEGITRVPYPTGYGPNAEDLAYEGEDFKDKDTALFVFGENGVFQDVTGIVDGKYATNGMIQWHPGLVEVDGTVYYFIADVANGGNMPANGDTYITRNNGVAGFTMNDVYNFADGKLSGANGIVDMKYYKNSKLMKGAGLVEIDGNYIYVRSNGTIVANTSYYVTGTGIVKGFYDFDENGYMVNPVSSNKNGVIFENGGYYYYADGVKPYAGLIKFSGMIDGVEYKDVYIYVRSNGQLATGTYWISKTNDLLEANVYIFNDHGVLDLRDGIVAENGSLYYYEDGILAKGAGLIEIDGNYYYVRSSGEVVNNCSYWITNTNDLDVIAKSYAFDANGVMQNVEIKDTSLNGVVNGYYYVDGQPQCGAGPIEWNGNIYYVRSNGQVATGTYWTTAYNELLPAGKHEFDADGKLIK